MSAPEAVARLEHAGYEIAHAFEDVWTASGHGVVTHVRGGDDEHVRQLLDHAREKAESDNPGSRKAKRAAAAGGEPAPG